MRFWSTFLAMVIWCIVMGCLMLKVTSILQNYLDQQNTRMKNLEIIFDGNP